MVEGRLGTTHELLAFTNDADELVGPASHFGVLLVADVELVAHTPTVVLDLGQQLALGVAVEVEFAFDLLAEVLASRVDFQIDLEVHVKIYF